MNQDQELKRLFIRELAESCRDEEQLRQFLSRDCGDTILVVSPGRRIVMSSNSVRTLFGYDVHEVVGRQTDVLYADRRSDPSCPGEIFQILEKDGCHVGTAAGRRKDGETVPIEILTAKLSHGKGAVLLLRETGQKDVAAEEAGRARSRAAGTTGHPSAEADIGIRERISELESTCAELQKLNQVKDEILASVSHEFRTPLTSIISFTELLLNYPDNPLETQKEFLSIIHSESRRLARLVGNVLDLSRLRSGKMAWCFRAAEAGPIVRKAVRALSTLMIEKRLRLETVLPDDLPDFAADEDMIIQVLVNLLSNAVKYTPEGGTICIAADLLDGRRTTDQGGYVHFAVADTGVGMKAEAIPGLFEPFQQCGNKAGERSEGTGLGLSICKEILQAHHGSIWAESAPGRGCTFHFTLPLASGRDRSPATTAHPDADASASAP